MRFENVRNDERNYVCEHAACSHMAAVRVRGGGENFLCEQHAGELLGGDFVPASATQRKNQCHEGRKDALDVAPCAPHGWPGAHGWLKRHPERRADEIFNVKWVRRGSGDGGASPGEQIYFCDEHVCRHITGKLKDDDFYWPESKQSDYEKHEQGGNYCEWGRRSQGRHVVCGATEGNAAWKRHRLPPHMDDQHPNFLCDKHYKMLSGEPEPVTARAVQEKERHHGANRKEATRQKKFEAFCRKLKADGKLAQLRRIEVEIELYGIEKVWADITKREEVA